MTLGRLASAAFTLLLGIIGVTFAAGNTWNTQAALPDQVTAIQKKQDERQEATNQHFQSVQQDITTVKQDVARVEGKVDTVIYMLQRRHD